MFPVGRRRRRRQRTLRTARHGTENNDDVPATTNRRTDGFLERATVALAMDTGEPSSDARSTPGVSLRRTLQDRRDADVVDDCDTQEPWKSEKFTLPARPNHFLVLLPRTNPPHFRSIPPLWSPFWFPSSHPSPLTHRRQSTAAAAAADRPTDRLTDRPTDCFLWSTRVIRTVFFRVAFGDRTDLIYVSATRR